MKSTKKTQEATLYSFIKDYLEYNMVNPHVFQVKFENR